MPVKTTNLQTTSKQFQTVTPKDHAEEVARAVEAEIRNMLGLSSTQSIPQDVQDAIKAKTSTAVNQQMQSTIARSAQKYATSILLKPDIQAAMKNKLALGELGMQAVVESTEYQKILDQNAVLLRRKYEALVKAGFKEEQAFRLIEAEIYAKGGRMAGQ